MNMMNKCTKFHEDIQNVQFNLASAIELSVRADYVYNFL